MAVTTFSMKRMKMPRAPKITAAKSSWDRYEKRKKEVEAHNKRVDAERARRTKIRQR